MTNSKEAGSQTCLLPSQQIVAKKLTQKSLLLWREKVRVRGTVSLTLISILSHPGSGGLSSCMETVSKSYP